MLHENNLTAKILLQLLYTRDVSIRNVKEVMPISCCQPDPHGSPSTSLTLSAITSTNRPLVVVPPPMERVEHTR